MQQTHHSAGYRYVLALVKHFSSYCIVVITCEYTVAVNFCDLGQVKPEAVCDWLQMLGQVSVVVRADSGDSVTVKFDDRYEWQVNVCACQLVDATDVGFIQTGPTVIHAFVVASLPLVCLGVFCHAFSYSSPATWNSIPISIKNCSSLCSFKHHLKSYFIAHLTNN